MEGVNSQLWAHFFMGLNTGVTEDQMRGIISVLEAEVGNKEAQNAYELLNEVLKMRARME